MQKTHEFLPADRYAYDFGPCSIKNGFAQVDTEQDASYYGTWANAERLIIVAYVEGDVYTTKCDTPEEFSSELRAIKHWNEKNGWKFKGIDPGLGETIKQQFVGLGLGDLLH